LWNSYKNRLLLRAGILLVFYPLTNLSQDLIVQQNNVGFNVGANIAIGSHFQRFGLNLNFFYVNNFFQTNTELRAYFSFKNLGPHRIYPEWVLAQGVVFGYGAKQNRVNPFINSISNQTGHLNAVAYSYNAYFNKIKTSQQTGIVAFQFGKITFIAENDILGHNYFDRYRTGAFLLQYQHEDKFQVAVSSILWTGEMGRIVRGDSGYKAICYVDTTGGRYTNISHGLLSVQFKYNIGLSQNLQANIGVDAEQVRNTIQNKLIHDMPFIPKRWNKPKNCHIPMLDRDGNQYLYRPTQNIKRAVLYMNLFSNPNVFY